MKDDRRLQQEYERMLAICRSEDYRNARAARKRDVLWEAVSREPFDPLPRMWVSRIMTYIRLANRRRLRQAFHVEDDVRPPRRKTFHPFGTVAKMRLEPVAGHPYTGLLQSGAVGFVRLSLARDPRTYSPSAAFKFFIDGKPSEHLVLDQSIDEQTSRDFFERAPTNITSWPQRGTLKYGWYILNWWLSSIADPLHQALDNIASVTSDGEPVAAPRVAYRISFFAPPELHTPPDSRTDFRVMAAKIPAGTVLFEVYVTGSPEQQEQTHVGTIITESPFVASAFGDNVLSLRHAYQHGTPQWDQRPQ